MTTAIPVLGLALELATKTQTELLNAAEQRSRGGRGGADEPDRHGLGR